MEACRKEITAVSYTTLIYCFHYHDANVSIHLYLAPATQDPSRAPFHFPHMDSLEYH